MYVGCTVICMGGVCYLNVLVCTVTALHLALGYLLGRIVGRKGEAGEVVINHSHNHTLLPEVP